MSQEPYEIELESPFPESEYPALWHWTEKFRSQVMDDSAPKTMQDFVRWQMQRASNIISWGVRRDGELGGYIEYEPIGLNIGNGHGIFKKEFWGQKTTLVAINMALIQVFSHGVDIVMFTPLVHNAAIRALNRRLGAVEVGRLRGRCTQEGKPVDQAVMVLLGDEWAEAQSEFLLTHKPPLANTG